jgi:hypothetical protein
MSRMVALLTPHSSAPTNAVSPPIARQAVRSAMATIFAALDPPSSNCAHPPAEPCAYSLPSWDDEGESFRRLPSADMGPGPRRRGLPQLGGCGCRAS